MLTSEVPAVAPEPMADGIVAVSTKSAIRVSSKAAAVDIRTPKAKQHSSIYHQSSFEESVALSLGEGCLVPTTIGNVDFAKESDASPPEVVPAIFSVLGMGGVNYVNGKKLATPLAYYCGSGQIVTCMGSLVYTYDDDRFTQTIWNNPEAQEVGTIAVSSDSRYVLVAEKPSSGKDKNTSAAFFSKQKIYAAATGSLLKTLPGTIAGGVSSAAFSHDGLELACLACDYQHSVTLFSTPQGTWKDAIRLSVAQIDSLPVTLVTFIVQDKSDIAGDSRFQLATGGEGPLRFWKLRGRNATASLNSNSAQKTPGVSSMISIQAGQLITGDQEGHISVWEGRDCVKVSALAHSDAITALGRFDSKKIGIGFVSASCDNIAFWNDKFEVLFRYSVAEQLEKIRRPVSQFPFVTSVSVDGNFRRVLITLQSSYMIEVALDSGSALLIAEGHSMGKFTALAAHPTNSDMLVTAGADALVKVWNVSARRVAAVEHIQHEATAAAFNRDGTQLVISTLGGDEGGGSLLILSFNMNGQSSRYLTVIDRIHNVGTSRINSIKFSPEQKLLAVGNSDGNVYFCSVEKGYKVKAVVSVHTGPVLSVDFSANGKYTRSFAKSKNSDTTEMVFTDLTKPSESGAVPSYVTVQPKDELTLRSLVNEQWISVSPAAPEARGARNVERNSENGLDDLFTSGPLSVASYSNGTAKLFR